MEQFAEGTLDLAAGTWYCVTHSQTMKVGKDCPFCVQEQSTDQEFSRWLDAQTF